MTTSNDIKELAAALVKVQVDLLPAKRESVNETLGRTYADLCAVIQAVEVVPQEQQAAEPAL